MLKSVATRIEYVTEIARHPLNRGGFLGAFHRYLSWNIGRRLIDCEYVIPLLENVSIIVSNEENYSTLAYTLNLWDFSEMSLLLHVLRKDDLFVDIGSNIGAYAVLASAGAGANVVAFEPVQDTFKKLQRNIRYNDVESLVDAQNVCVGEFGGSCDMTTEFGGLNRVANTKDKNTSKVQVVALNEFLGERCPLIMKIDVEGFEMPVLKGSHKFLNNSDLILLIVEHNNSGIRYGYSDEEVHRYITDHGFSTFCYNPFERTLVSTSNRINIDGHNTLYCREIEKLESRINSANKFAVNGMEV